MESFLKIIFSPSSICCPLTFYREYYMITKEQQTITPNHYSSACAAPCTSAWTRGSRKVETSDEHGEWTVESADAWQAEARIERRACEGRGSRGFCVRDVLFGFTNDIQTLKCGNFLVKYPFVIPFAPARSL
jgi:hypothetical protein